MRISRLLLVAALVLLGAGCAAAPPDSKRSASAEQMSDADFLRLLTIELGLKYDPRGGTVKAGAAHPSINNALAHEVLSQVAASESETEGTNGIPVADSKNAAMLRDARNGIRRTLEAHIENLASDGVDGYKKNAPFFAAAGMPVVRRDFSQGAARQTGQPMDVMICGLGFFQVKGHANEKDGMAYTRCGKMLVNADGELKIDDGGEGFQLDPPVTVSRQAMSVDIGCDGRVYCVVPGSTAPVLAGQIQLATFSNPQGLASTNGIIFTKTDDSGQPILDNPGTGTTGTLQSGCLEASNTDSTEEMLEVLQLTRWYRLINRVLLPTTDGVTTLSDAP